MKLKTIEDFYKLPKANFSNKGEKPKGFDIDSEELRQEAIKYIKDYKKRIEEHSHKKFDEDEPYMNCLQCRNLFVQIGWIKYFFSITEEELK